MENLVILRSHILCIQQLAGKFANEKVSDKPIESLTE